MEICCDHIIFLLRLLVGLRLMFIAPLAKSEIIQLGWRFNSMFTSFWHDYFVHTCAFPSFSLSLSLSLFVSFMGNRKHFLLFGQWGAFKSIVYKIKMEKCHHFFVRWCWCCRQIAILVFLNFVPETTLPLMPNIESVAPNMLLCLLILCKRYHSSVKSVNNINKMVLPLRICASVCGCVRCKSQISRYRLWVAFYSLSLCECVHHSALVVILFVFGSYFVCAGMFALLPFSVRWA